MIKRQLEYEKVGKNAAVQAIIQKKIDAARLYFESGGGYCKDTLDSFKRKALNPLLMAKLELKNDEGKENFKDDLGSAVYVNMQLQSEDLASALSTLVDEAFEFWYPSKPSFSSFYVIIHIIFIDANSQFFYFSIIFKFIQ